MIGEVSVSEDGSTWSTFPCTAKEYPYGSCAGWRPVNATPNDPVDVAHPEKAGGDPFDLAEIGVARAKYVRIRDAHSERAACCGTAGFDLDAAPIGFGAFGLDLQLAAGQRCFGEFRPVDGAGVLDDEDDLAVEHLHRGAS